MGIICSEINVRVINQTVQANSIISNRKLDTIILLTDTSCYIRLKLCNTSFTPACGVVVNFTFNDAAEVSQFNTGNTNLSSRE